MSMRGGAVVAREAHNLEVAGSTPAPAIIRVRLLLISAIDLLQHPVLRLRARRERNAMEGNKQKE